ncbi:MAG: hypothetical protein JJT96_20770 [Opitutales bacterium]|nr:hypothetical protein [Opitutales bacterium]
MDALIEEGFSLILPEEPQIAVNDWHGIGYIIYGFLEGEEGQDPLEWTAMMISGGYKGGYPGIEEMINAFLAQLQAITGPQFVVPGPSYHTNPQSSEPVDLASGAYFLDTEDLTVGGAGVRGLAFARNYNSNRRDSDSTGLGPGWTHNYHMRVVERSAPEATLGLTTPQEAAAFIVSVFVAADLFANPTTAKDWVLPALVAHWGVESIYNNAAVVSVGQKSYQFINAPDGSFLRTAGIPAELSLVDGNYVLTEPFGNTFRFDAAGRIAEIEDFFGLKKSFAYQGDRLHTVTDAFLRTFTFGYSGNRLTSITEDTAPAAASGETVPPPRSINFGHNAAGDLSVYTDPENKQWEYEYEPGHKMWRLRDAEGRIIATNVYDSFDRVIEQRAYGRDDETWTFHYAGYSTIEQNPLDGRVRYFFDDHGRTVSRENEVGDRSHTRYDGQHRPIVSISPRGREVRSYYDAEHNLRAQSDAREGEVTGLVLDEDFELVATQIAPGVQPKGTVTLFTYDALNRITGVTVKDLTGDYPARSTAFVYDPANSTNLPDKVFDPKGNETEFTYHPDGLLWKETEVSITGNRTTTHLYDSRRLPATVTYHDESFESFDFDPRGDLKMHTSRRGVETEFRYNDRRQLTKTIQPGPDGDIVNERTYDPSGNVQHIIDAENRITRQEWGPQRKLLRTIQAHGTPEPVTTHFHYDRRDWLERVVDPLDRETHIEYFATQRIKTITDPLLRKTHFTYDADGNRTSVTTHGNIETSSTFDEWGNPLTMTDGEQKTVTYGFNSFGEHVTLQNRRNHTFSFSYNANGAPETLATPLAHTTTTTWTDRNLIDYTEKARTPTIRATFAHDDLRRVSSITDPLGTIEFSWDGEDDNGNLLQTVTEGGKVITRVFDSVERIKRHTDSNGHTIAYEWYDNGLLKKVTYLGDGTENPPENRSVTYTYDEINRLKTVTDWHNRVTTYHWTDAGELERIDRPNGVNRVQTYTPAGELERITERDEDGKLLAYFRFRYDANARIERRLRLPQPQEVNLPPFAAMYDNDNRLATWNGTTVVHDADGNMTTGPLFGHGLTTYVYDARDRLTSAGGVTYEYDAENQRVSLTTAAGPVRYVTDPNAGGLSRLLVRERPDGSRTFYVYGLGLLYEIDEAGAATYYHFDQIGSTVMLTDSDGAVSDRIEYSPYGTITHWEGETDTPFLYVGQFGVQTDPNGLLYMRARYYSPELRRFINADPIRFGGGMNWYAYANGNPMMFIDPTGEVATPFPLIDLWGSAVGGATAIFYGGDVREGISLGRDGARKGAYAFADGVIDGVPGMKLQPLANLGLYDPDEYGLGWSQVIGSGTRDAALFLYIGSTWVAAPMRVAPALGFSGIGLSPLGVLSVSRLSPVLQGSSLAATAGYIQYLRIDSIYKGYLQYHIGADKYTGGDK